MSDFFTEASVPPPTPVSGLAWAYAESWLDDVEQVRVARATADELGIGSISHATARLLTLLVTLTGASNIVEVGTGTGVSGAALLQGMSSEGVLTSIDLEAENQRVARETFTSLGYDHVHTRLITGRALEVLPRLSDKAYDVVFASADRSEYPAVLGQATRLLRPGGLVVFDQVLSDGHIAEPGRHDAETIALRDVTHALRDEDQWLPSLLTVGGGLLIGSLRTTG